MSDPVSAEAFKLAIRDLDTTALSIRTSLSASGGSISDESRAELENFADAVEHLARLFRSAELSADNEADTEATQAPPP